MSDAAWSWVLAGQAFFVTALLTDGRRRVLACWAGLITEPIWIIAPFVKGHPEWGFAVLGAGYALNYAWGIVRDNVPGLWIRSRAQRIRHDALSLLRVARGSE